MTAVNTDRIEKTMVLRAPRARVWRAIQHLDRISRQWDDALDRLKKLVEE